MTDIMERTHRNGAAARPRSGEGTDPQITAAALRMLRDLHAMHGPAEGGQATVRLHRS